MSGQIDSVGGKVKVEIHKVFRVLITIMLVLPLLGVTVIVATGTKQLSPFMVLFAIGQILMIRYVFITLAFRLLSKGSLMRLRDVLDLEWC
ncbi:hypothetical protein [Sphingobacterium paucimobilis]|uniref:Uncharacterized protein n=1 Tax=Sphingobacterium paucimobilis HER1398 TaxID=1346330 RepID=U2JCN0_9SPHI|nr:hypothetical protein [Sphingobacterium paucimobilis]ERJ60433.1 hypothetical protein M472_16900 [Sphingobacterium paucimobilis HER1398]